MYFLLIAHRDLRMSAQKVMQCRRSGFLRAGKNKIELLDFTPPGSKHERKLFKREGLARRQYLYSRIAVTRIVRVTPGDHTRRFRGPIVQAKSGPGAAEMAWSSEHRRAAILESSSSSGGSIAFCELEAHF